MREIANLKQANAVLAAFVPRARDTGAYTLGRMRQLMNCLDNPQNKLRVIHVAGTSGKTSTCYYISALLGAAGLKTGLTVSPHVTNVNERVQVNTKPLAESKFCSELTEFLKLVEKSGLQPSYFEVLVAFAYWEFYRQKVDYAVIEVGLGGLLDGTNVVERADKVCVITDIGLDHINVLGDTLEEIAFQKAGIIQPGNETFCNRQASKIIDVFRERARQQKARLHVISAGQAAEGLAFLPLFQQRNFNLARTVSDFVLRRDGHKPLSSTATLKAAQTIIPARMETFNIGKKTVILDGAHNAQKLAALKESIKARFPNQKIIALVSFVDGRGFRIESSLKELAQLTDTLIITSFQRAKQDLPYGPVQPELLAQQALGYGFKKIETIDDPLEAYHKLLACQEPILLITGSFYLVDDLRPEAIRA